MTTRSPNLRLFLIAIILIFTWGCAYTFVGVIVNHVAPIWLVSWRCILAAILVTAYTVYRGHAFPPLRDKRWLWYFGFGLIGLVAPFFMLSQAQTKVDSGLTAILVGAMPLITIVLAHFFAEERLTPRKIFGFILGFIGTVILFLPDTLSLSLVENWRSQLLIVAAATCYAVTTVLAKRAPETSSLVGAAIMLISAAISSTAIGIIQGPPQDMPAPFIILLIVLLSVLGTAMGNILYLDVIQKYGPSVLAKINYFPPIVSVIAGIVFIGEPFSWKIVIAFLIILAGLLIARSKPEKPPAINAA